MKMDNDTMLIEMLREAHRVEISTQSFDSFMRSWDDVGPAEPKINGAKIPRAFSPIDVSIAPVIAIALAQPNVQHIVPDVADASEIIVQAFARNLINFKRHSKLNAFVVWAV